MQVKQIKKMKINLEQVMKLLQQQFESIPSKLKILAVTWNLVGTIPPQKYLDQFFNSFYFTSKPDVIFIGTQQCQLSLFWSFFWQSKPKWETILVRYLTLYHLFATSTLQGLHSAVLVLKEHTDQTQFINKKALRAGFCCGLFGNKGAIQIKIKMYGQYFQFINCHLAPHQDGAKQRNQTLMRILNNLVCFNLATQIILLGDMNYRLQIKNQEYKHFLSDKKTNTQIKIHYQKMFSIEQLTNQEQLRKYFFTIFQEHQISFPPTYKMNLHNDQYNRSRVPGWTDRIFAKKGKIKQLQYNTMYHIYGSDHRPVFALYSVNLKEGLALFEDQTFKIDRCQIV